MFTEMPGLAQSIERLIDATPIIDPHTHIHCDRPSAPDLGALLGYHWVQTELIAVGMPKADLDPALPVDERIRRMIPYLKRMRNTAMSWCVTRILWDLYEFAEPEVTESNYRDLLDRVAAKGNDPEWPKHVLRDRCHIETFVTSLGNREASSSVAPDALFMLDAHYLFCPGVATDLDPFFTGRTRKLEYFEALCQVLGDRPATTDRLKQLLFDWLDRTVTGPVRFTNTFIPIEQRFRQPDEPHAQLTLSQMGDDWAVSEKDVDALVNFVTWSILEWNHEHKKALQIAVGAEYFICDGKSIPRFQPNWTSEMAQTFHHFGNTRFDLMMASDVLSQEVAVLARQFPNVYTSGYWWHTFFPTIIERHFGMRSQVVPMTKFCGYLSDSYSVEWVYGKLQIVKRAIASALARQVEAGFAREEDLPALLTQVLHDSPRDLYDLHR